MNSTNDFAIKAGTAFNNRFNEWYFNSDGGLEEATHVFLNGNNLGERFSKQDAQVDSHPGGTFTIAETGFGAGLNFLSTVALWNKRDRSTGFSRLHYYSCELYPLTPRQISAALASWPELAALVHTLTEVYPKHYCASWISLEFSSSVRLSLYFGDAQSAYHPLSPAPLLSPEEERSLLIGSCRQLRAPYVDAWYFDGFSPSNNADMWSFELFNNAARLSNERTSFATFSCARIVRDNLDRAGARWRKQSGFGQKRQMLSGYFSAPTKAEIEWGKSDRKYDEKANQFSRRKSSARSNITHSFGWHLPEATPPSNTPNKLKVQVKGAGIAGAFVASALAKRGVKVFIHDIRGIAAGASGNLQAAIYSRFWQQSDLLNAFNLKALQYAQSVYFGRQAFPPECVNQCGLVLIAKSIKQAEHMKQFALENPLFASFHRARSLSQLTNAVIGQPGLYLEQAGYINPQLIIGELLSHPNITKISTKESQSIAFDHTVHCVGYENDKLFTEHKLTPFTKPVVGQVTQVGRDLSKRALQSVVCSDRYATPVDLQCNMSSVGASYRIGSKTESELSLQSSSTEMRENLSSLVALGGIQAMEAEEAIGHTSFSTEAETAKASILTNRVSVRATTADYFPICGRLPNEQTMRSRFAYLQRDATRKIVLSGCYQPNAFILTGLGSRGMTYAPLCAEMIASEILNEAPPVDRATAIRLSPARFIIRDLMRPKR